MHTCEGIGRYNYRDWEPCGKPAKVERDGKWYCGRCDPVAVATRREVPSAVLCHASIAIAAVCGTNPVNVRFGGGEEPNSEPA